MFRENSIYNNSVLMNSSSQFNSSFNFNLKPESFAESYIPTHNTNNSEKNQTIDPTNKEAMPIKNITLDDIKNLRSRFDKVYQKLKKTADTQDNYLNRIASEEKNIRSFNQALNKEIDEKPSYLNYKKEIQQKENSFIIDLEKPKTELYRISLRNFKKEESETSETIDNSANLHDREENQVEISEKHVLDKAQLNLTTTISPKSKPNSKNISKERSKSNRDHSGSKASEANQIRKNLDNLFKDNDKNYLEIPSNEEFSEVKPSIDSCTFKSKNMSKAFQNTNFNNYKSILNRVRENSQDEANRMSSFNDKNVTRNIKTIKIDDEEGFSSNNKYEQDLIQKENYMINPNHISKVVKHKNSNNMNSHILNKESEYETNRQKNKYNMRINVPNEPDPIFQNKRNSKEKEFNCQVNKKNAENTSDDENENNKYDKTEYYYFNYDFRKKKNNRQSSNLSNYSQKSNRGETSMNNQKNKREENDHKLFDQSVNRILDNYNAQEEEEIDNLNTSVNSNLSISKLNFHINPVTKKRDELNETMKSKYSNRENDFNNSRVNLNKFARNRQDDFTEEMTVRNKKQYNNHSNYHYNKNVMGNYNNDFEENEYCYNQNADKKSGRNVKKDKMNEEYIDDDLVIFLNSKSSKYNKNKNDFRKGDGIEYHSNNYNNPSLNKRIEFYDNNLFDLIDDLEKKESQNLNKFGSSYGKENTGLKRPYEIENNLNSIEKERQ